MWTRKQQRAEHRGYSGRDQNEANHLVFDAT